MLIEYEDELSKVDTIIAKIIVKTNPIDINQFAYKSTAREYVEIDNNEIISEHFTDEMIVELAKEKTDYDIPYSDQLQSDEIEIANDTISKVISYKEALKAIEVAIKFGEQTKIFDNPIHYYNLDKYREEVISKKDEV